MSWIQRGVDINSEAAGDSSGYSVSLNSTGDVVAIGATLNNGNGTDSGHVRVYSWNGSSWVQRGSDIDGEATNDYSGFSVSLNSTGDVVAIGTPINGGNGVASGHVRIYSWNGSSWIQRGSDIDGEAAGDNSGFSVSLNSTGDVVAIGASNNDGNGNASGHVRIYSWNGSSWIQRGTDIDGEAANDFSGYSVSLNSNGDVVAIGAIYNNGNGTDSGHVRIYSWNGSSWIQRGTDINGEAANDRSGYSVSLNSTGDVVAIGAPNNNGNGSNSGHVRVYSWNGSSWIQRGTDINGEAAGDVSGYSVSLNSTGDVVAIGAPYNDGSNSGHVRVYSWNGSSWVQRGTDIDGEATDDYSGYSVSLNSTGDVVAIGAPSNNGQVRVYSFTTTTTTAAPIITGSCHNKQYSAIQIRRGSSSQFTSSNPILASGEPAYAIDSREFKIGDGVTPWINLPPIIASGSLLQFSPISSSGLATLITDETGSGLAVFNDSPSFTGIPLVPTATSGTNTNQIASTAFVRTEISNLVDSAPALLDTLNELAAAINDDANFATTIANELASKAPLVHTHTSSNITDFDSAVSGLLPVKNISAGSGIGVTSVSGDFTVSVTGLVYVSGSGVDSIMPFAGNNYVEGSGSTIAGGTLHIVYSDNSFIGGGTTNNANGVFSFVGGGSGNLSGGEGSVIGGGLSIAATGDYSAILGGSNNSAGGENSVIVGGSTNQVHGLNSFIGGGINHSALGDYGVIVGGNQNSISIDASYGFIGGGEGNSIAGDTKNIIVGGWINSISGAYNFIGGGAGNNINNNAENSIIIGGSDNSLSSNWSSILGGHSNIATASYSTILGGTGAKTTLSCEVSHGCDGFTGVPGNAQHSMMVIQAQTTNDSETTLYNLGGALVVPPSTTWTFSIKVSAYSYTDKEGAWWIIRGGIRRDDSNNTTLIGSLIIENSAETSLSSTTVDVIANDSNESLDIKATGISGKTIGWVATIDINQISFNSI